MGVLVTDIPIWRKSLSIYNEIVHESREYGIKLLTLSLKIIMQKYWNKDKGNGTIKYHRASG